MQKDKGKNLSLIALMLLVSTCHESYGASSDLMRSSSGHLLSQVDFGHSQLDRNASFDVAQTSGTTTGAMPDFWNAVSPIGTGSVYGALAYQIDNQGGTPPFQGGGAPGALPGYQQPLYQQPPFQQAPFQPPYQQPAGQQPPGQQPPLYQEIPQAAPQYQGGTPSYFQAPMQVQGSATYFGGQAGGGDMSGGAPANYQDSFHVPPSYYNQGGYAAPPQSPQVYSDRQIYAPAGLVLPVTLQTAISTQVAKPGDYIQATISQNVSLGGRAYLPSGTQVVGSVSDSVAGRRLSRSGELSLAFNSLRLPNGQQLPITAHLMGDLGKYTNKGTGTSDVYRGEGWGTKLGQTALRGGLGAGFGAGLGTAVGAIAGGGHGAGMGAWSGAAIGGGIGLADMLMRKGKDVIVPTGTAMQIQLDQPLDMGSSGGPGGPPPQSWTGTF